MVSFSYEQTLARQWLEAAMAGDFESAWAVSDLLRQAGIEYSARERWSRPLWDGSPIDDRNVLIRCWRGLGDAIHFIRYAPLVRVRARSLVVEAPEALIPLFRTVRSIDRLLNIDPADAIPEDLVAMESTELPYVFRTTLATIPCEVPYLDVPAALPKKTRKRLRVGLCWCGGSYDPRRSISLADLEPLAAFSTLNFFQLQRGKALQEAFQSSFRFRNPKDRSMDICRTASLIKSLDVVVSVDTMVAHLAGALGKKVYVLLHSEADWRWLRRRKDSPWYPTARLLRQSEAGNWKPVVSELVDILAQPGMRLDGTRISNH